MRQLKRIITLLLTVLLFFYSKLNAQHVGFIFGHALYASPVDKNFKNNYSTGIGVEAGGGIGLNKTFIVGTVGFSNFFHKDNNEAGDLTYIPLKVGLRQYILMKTIYLHGDVGLGKVKSDAIDEGRFSGDIGAGVKFAHLEIQVDYDGFTRKDPSGYASWIGLKAGLEFGL